MLIGVMRTVTLRLTRAWKAGHIPGLPLCATYSIYLNDIIRVIAENEPGLEDRNQVQCLYCWQMASSGASSSSKIFYLHLYSPPSPCFHQQLCHSPSLSFSCSLLLTFQATVSLSPTLSINICLWDCLPFAAIFWRKQGIFIPTGWTPTQG